MSGGEVSDTSNRPEARPAAWSELAERRVTRCRGRGAAAEVQDTSNAGVRHLERAEDEVPGDEVPDTSYADTSNTSNPARKAVRVPAWSELAEPR